MSQAFGTTIMILNGAVIIVLFVFGAVGLPLFAQSDKKPEDEGRAARLAAALELAKAIKVCRVTKDGQEPVELIEKPLLTYGDVPRDNDNGTVWAWGRTGRPVAMLELYRNTQDELRRAVHVVTSTSLDLVAADVGGGVQWSPRKAGVEFKPLGDAATPADTEPQRLRQMKEFVRRFAAHEFWDPDNQRYELRLLAQPVHRYSDPKSKLLDGVIFIFAHGTNPEVIVLIEAAGADAATAKWQYGLVRMGSAEMHVSLAGREVWTISRTPGVIGQPTDPYWMFFKPALRATREEPENRP